MKTVALAFRYLWSRPLAATLNLLLLSLGLASITFVLLVGQQAGRSFQRELAGIDLVVGAKGSPLQLILAGVFHIDVPPGNIRLADVQGLAARPEVAQVMPLSLGDSFRGFRIVGSTPDYPAHHRLRVAEGTAWARPMEVTLGAEVARATGLRPGQQVVGSHGLGGGAAHHEAYTITGVYAPCGCVMDRLILTSLESVWEVHAGHGLAPAAASASHAGKNGHASEHGKGDHQHGPDAKAVTDPREVTIALVRYRTPLAAVSVPRLINSSTAMQAAAPAVEVTRLLRLLGVGGEVLQGLGVVLLLTAGLSVFAALWNAVRERQADLAMLRMLGAPPARVGGLVLAEALWLAAMASVLGMALGHGLVALLGQALAEQQSLPLSGAVWLPQEAWIPLAAAAVAGLAALGPAVQAYRVDVSRLLRG